MWTEYDWNFTTVPQNFLDNRPRVINQGRSVGGSSILNGMIWTRGSVADFQTWVDLGNPGWSWSDLFPYFKKVRTGACLCC